MSSAIGGVGSGGGGGVSESDPVESGVDAAAAALEQQRRAMEAARLAELNGATPEQVQQVIQSFTPQNRFETSGQSFESFGGPVVGKPVCEDLDEVGCDGLAPSSDPKVWEELNKVV